MSDTILVLNAGSSSLKFGAYARAAPGPWQLAARGKVDGLGTAPRFVVQDGAGHRLVERALDAGVADVAAALDTLADWFGPTFEGSKLVGVGHRVVHGGADRAAPARVSPAVMEEMRALVPLAPLHQPANLAAIAAIERRMPGVPQVACFDTSFHRGHSEIARLVPLPAEIRRAGVQRYGFHGLSCEYVAERLAQAAPEIAMGRVIVAHLGSGASLCALRNGKSVDSTFGFTALDGLCMGTRPGAVDPGVVLYLFQELGLSAQEVESLLYTKSGLLGISSLSNDMRDLLECDAPAARLAVDYFVYRAVRETGALAAVLGGIDGIVFTAGIGENSPVIRERITAGCAWLGIELDRDANARGGPRISRAAGRASAWVIPTDEERMIARHTAAVLGYGEI